MKNKLLITTALIAVFKLNNVYATQTLPDLNVTDRQEITESTGVSYNTIIVAKNAELTLNGANIKTSAKENPSNDIVINGTLNLKNESVLEAGSDTEYLTNNSNILLDGATVTMNDSDLEANGNITIKNTNLTSTSQNPEEYGIWADGDITLEGGETTLSNSYLASGGNMTIQSGTINGSGSSDILLSSDGKNKHKLDINGGNITLSDNSGIHSEGLDAQYNEKAADINLNGGNITIKNGGEITLTGNGNMNIGGNANITMDYSSEVAGDDLHNGGILHEGQSGDINISGGKINLTGEVAKIERGGYDGDWIYSATGETLMSEEEFYKKTNKWFDQATDEDIRTAGLNPDEIDKNQYHVSTGDINISGGEINLTDNARISTTHKNTGDININGGTIKSDNGSILNNGTGDININGGVINLTNPDNEFKQASSKGEGIFGSNVSMSSAHKINMSAGEVTLDQTSMNGWDSIEMSGGTLNLTSEANNMTATLWSKGDILLSGGTINATNAAINTFYVENGVDSKGNIIIDGGTINVSKDSNLNLGSKGEINFKSGTINIAQDGNLTISDKYTDDWRFDIENVGTMLFGQQAVFNLNGDIEGNVSGNGTVNFLSNNAKIKGNVNMTEGGVMNIGLNNAVIEGDAIFNSGSTLKLEIADSGNGSLTANNITGEEGSKLALNITKKMELKDVLEDVVLFNGNVTNNFTEELSNNRYSVKKNSDGKSYDITYIATASDVVSDAGGTASNASTAEAWDALAQSSTASASAKAVADVLNDLSLNNEQAYVDALTAVAPEVVPMVQKTQTETANQVFGAVSTRLTGGSISTGGEGMSSGDNIFERAAVWVQGMFNKSKLDDTSKAKGFDADSAGVAFGAEKFVTDDTKIGIGYAYTNTDIDGFMRSTDVDTHTAILYGEYKPNNWYVNGIATYGWSDYSEDKSVSGVGVKADYDVETFGLQAMTGYDMQVKGFGLTPEVGLRYVHISQDGYTDSADQKVSGNDSDILTGVIGAKVSKTWTLENGMNIKPEARIAATYDLMNDDVNSVVTLANGSAYAVEGEALDRFGMEFGAGITAEVNDYVELSLSYEGKFRKDYQDHTGLLNAKYNF